MRNKLIAKVFFDMGIIEHYGMGISKIKEECEKNSNPYPEWDNRLGAFTTVYRTRTAKPSQTNTKTIKIITPLQKKILLLLSQNPQVSKRQLAEKLPEETAGSIKYNIAQLQKFGLLKHSGPDHGGKWEVFVD